MTKNAKTSTKQVTVVTEEQPVTETKKTYNLDQLKKDHGSLSGVIRFLAKEGLSRGEIAKVVDRRYQHVRNVLITPVGKQNEAQ